MTAKGRLVTLLLGLVLGVTGCAQTPPVGPSGSPTPTLPRPFTVMTSQPITTTDPAAARTETDSMVVLNLFQRLMVYQPLEKLLKPDAAQDCLYRSPTVYECTLAKNLVFNNGHLLTSSDVKFSLQRAYRLETPNTSISMLDSLDRIETPNAQTIRFHLKWADTQFGYALSGPAASIVDEEAYDADAVRPIEYAPMGSGPYELQGRDDKGATFSLNTHYVGPDVGEIETIRLAYATDSPTAEKAIAEGTVDVVWRTLDPAALARLTAEIDAGEDEKSTKQGFTRWPMPGARSQLLLWNPKSPHRADANLRSAITLALQADRTMDSIVPSKVTGHVSAFPVGGKPKQPKVTGSREKLTLSYDPTSPGHADLARTIRDRLENSAGVSVRITHDDMDADLFLTDRGGWIDTAFGWLQRYLDYPLPGSAAKLRDLSRRARTTTDEDARLVALGEIQKQAAADGTIVPVAQSAGTLFVGKGITLVGECFGPGWQLGLWGIRNG